MGRDWAVRYDVVFLEIRKTLGKTDMLSQITSQGTL